MSTRPPLVRASFVLLLSSPLCLAQERPSPDAGSAGIRVDPSTFGPVTIESMQKVVERQAALRAGAGAGAGARAPVVHGTRNGAQGIWLIPSRRSHPQPHSAPHSVINKWGDTRMGIGFGRRVDFVGAWFAGQGGRGAWTNGIRIVGYRAGKEVARTDWFAKVGPAPTWFAADLENVDRIEIRSRAVLDGAGWYSLDDLTYRLPPVDDGAPGPRIVVDFDDLTYRKIVTGSRYAGLTWETGTGPFRGWKGGRSSRVGSSRVGSDRVGVVSAPRTPAPRVGAPPPDPVGGPGRIAFAQNQGTTPNLITQIEGPKLSDPGGSWVPPDTCGACGLDHFVSIVNMNLSVFRKTDGARVVNVGMNAFFGKNVGDPRIVFDPDSKRFFITGMDGPAGNLYLAASLTSDPTGKWFKTSWLAGVGSDKGTWPDFPTLGVDKRGVYMAALMVGRSTITVWAIQKAPLLQTTPALGTVTAWRGLPWEGAVQPCVTYGDDGRGYLVSRVHTALLRVRHIEWPTTTAPKLVETGIIPVQNNDRAPNAPALGSRVNLSTGDFRPSFAVYRNHSIWTAQTVVFNGRAAVRWYEINSKNLHLRQIGTVSDPVRHYFYPSITVNARGDAAMGFSGSHAGEYAGCYFTGRLAGDPVNEMGKPVLLQAGLGAYNVVTGNGVVRWGDYSATTVDPADDRTFWTIQEYAHTNNRWGTRIGRLDFDWFSYGTGWPGTTGAPDLTLNGHPYLRTAPLIQIGNSRGASTTGWLVLGAAPANIPLLDGTLLVQPAVNKGVVVPAQGLSLLVLIPNDPTLLQQSFYMQNVQVDAGASKGLAFSRGLEVRIGR